MLLLTSQLGLVLAMVFVQLDVLVVVLATDVVMLALVLVQFVLLALGASEYLISHLVVPNVA